MIGFLIENGTDVPSMMARPFFIVRLRGVTSTALDSFGDSAELSRRLSRVSAQLSASAALAIDARISALSLSSQRRLSTFGPYVSS